MSIFTRLFILGTFAVLLVMPMIGNRRGWFIGTERNQSIISQAQSCAAEFRDSSGKCLASSRNVRMRRSVFGGSYGHGK